MTGAWQSRPEVAAARALVLMRYGHSDMGFTGFAGTIAGSVENPTKTHPGGAGSLGRKEQLT